MVIITTILNNLTSEIHLSNYKRATLSDGSFVLKNLIYYLNLTN